MKIGLDTKGGDFAPEAIVKGALLAVRELPSDIRLVLIGDQEQDMAIVSREGGDPSLFDFVHAEEAIEMGESPAKAFARKPNSSIAKGFGMLQRGLIDGFASAGNTGAMLVGAVYSVKVVPGVIRPCIAGFVPRLGARPSVLVDVGLNPDCKPDVLYQYAILGSRYSQAVDGVENPRVALLNIGTEDEKGSLLAKAAFEAMKDSSDFSFVGNIEGTDLFGSSCPDVIVCDGFVGNIVLKEAESFYHILQKRGIRDDFFEQFNFEHYGGTPILGINAPVIIGHGISNDVAIKNMVFQTRNVIEAGLSSQFQRIFEKGQE